VKVIDVEQGTPEWHQIRLGRLTGSVVSDAFSTIKSGWGAGRKNLRVRLVLERLTGKSQESGFSSFDMERGTLLEPDARSAYEVETGLLVQQVGFVAHDDLMAGCSPDGLTEDGLVDFKCPKAATHLDYLRGGLPNDYRLQLIHGLWITGRQWAEMVSFHPEFPESVRLKVTRIYAKDLDLNAHELNVRLFLNEVDAELAEVQALMGAAV
jgi:hypothetical protein